MRIGSCVCVRELADQRTPHPQPLFPKRGEGSQRVWKRPSVRRQTGFTLIEMIVVTMLLAMMGGLALVSVRGPLDQATLQRAVSQVIAADTRERTAARLRPPGATDSGQLAFSSRNGELTYLASARTLRLGGQVRATDLVRWTGRGWDASGDIAFAASGQSDTYSLRLQSPSGAAVRLLFLGISGQAVELDETEFASVETLLRRLGG